MSSKGQCYAECFILWEEAFASGVNFIVYSGDLGMDHGVGSQRTLRNAQGKAVTRRKQTPTSLESGKSRKNSKEELRRWLGEGAERLLHKRER